MRLWLEKIPPHIVGNAFLKIERTLGIAILNDMEKFMYATAYIFRILTNPLAVESHHIARCDRRRAESVLELESQLLRRFPALRRKHLHKFRIPLAYGGSDFRHHPLTQFRRGGCIENVLVFRLAAGKAECTALHYVGVSYLYTLKFATVKPYRSRRLGRRFGSNRKLLAATYINRNARKLRFAYHILSATRIERIEAKAGKYIPRAHLPTIVISAKSRRRRIVLRLHHLPYILRREVAPPKKREEVNVVVARLIAVAVLPDKAGNIRRCFRKFIGILIEERIEPLECSLLAAKHVNKEIGILHNMPIPVESVTFCVIVVAFAMNSIGIERFAPIAFSIASANKSSLGVVALRPGAGAFKEEFRIRIPPQLLCHPVRASVVVTVLQ